MRLVFVGAPVFVSFLTPFGPTTHEPRLVTQIFVFPPVSVWGLGVGLGLWAVWTFDPTVFPLSLVPASPPVAPCRRDSPREAAEGTIPCTRELGDALPGAVLLTFGGGGNAVPEALLRRTGKYGQTRCLRLRYCRG